MLIGVVNPEKLKPPHLTQVPSTNDIIKFLERRAAAAAADAPADDDDCHRPCLTILFHRQDDTHKLLKADNILLVTWDCILIVAMIIPCKSVCKLLHNTRQLLETPKMSIRGYTVD